MPSPFLRDPYENPYDDPEQAELEQLLALTRSAKGDPSVWLRTQKDWRQPTRGGGGGGSNFLARPVQATKTPSGTLGANPAPGEPVQAAGTENRSPMLQRLDAAYSGGEDPDEDRVMPTELAESAAKSSEADSKYLSKPPGPDSPAYKDPAAPFMTASGVDAKQKAYDERWDSSGKYKGKFWIAGTEQRDRRRQMELNELNLAKGEGIDAYNRALLAQPRGSGHVFRMVGDQGDGMYEQQSDGVYKKVGGVLDKPEDVYEPGTVINEEGEYGRVRHGTTDVETLTKPSPGAPISEGTGDASLQGPGASTARQRWLAPKKDYKLGYGQTLYDSDGNPLAEGRDRPLGTSTPSSKIDPVRMAAANDAGAQAAAALETEDPKATKLELAAAFSKAKRLFLEGKGAPAGTPAAKDAKRIQGVGEDGSAFSYKPPAR